PARSPPDRCLCGALAGGTTKCWPWKSNSVRLGSFVSRAPRVDVVWASAGVLANRASYDTLVQFRARAQLTLLPDPQPLADLCDEVGHRTSLRRFVAQTPEGFQNVQGRR